jgi:hypothetical protein
MFSSKKPSPVVLYEPEHRPNNYLEDISITYRFDNSDFVFLKLFLAKVWIFTAPNNIIRTI